MLSQTHYLIRSRVDGQYLVARLKSRDDSKTEVSYILLFQENYDALTYLNQHAAGMSDRFAVESLPATQLKGLMKRWGFQGIGLVSDPLEPQIQFLVYQ
jgi:hypothetical protein